MAPETAFHYEIEKSEDKNGNEVTTIKCHGRLIAGNSGEIAMAVKPLIPLGGRIVIDLGELTYLDSSGLGQIGSPEGIRNQAGLLHIGTRQYDTARAGTAQDYESDAIVLVVGRAYRLPDGRGSERCHWHECNDCLAVITIDRHAYRGGGNTIWPQQR
jgi:anti-anti-sigma regulatory factor